MRLHAVTVNANLPLQLPLPTNAGHRATHLRHSCTCWLGPCPLLHTSSRKRQVERVQCCQSRFHRRRSSGAACPGHVGGGASTGWFEKQGSNRSSSSSSSFDADNRAAPAAAAAAAADFHVEDAHAHGSSEFATATGSLSDEDGHGDQGANGTAPNTYNKATALYQVLRLDRSGKVRQVYARRRDLLREYRLQPRDLRRIDPSVDVNKTPPSITMKDNVVLLCLGGVRAIVTAEKVLLFEPHLPGSQKFIQVVLQHVQTRQQGLASLSGDPVLANASYREYSQRKGDAEMSPPFELEVIESALMVATGLLESTLGSVTQRVSELLSKLPQSINSVTLEELRRVKGALVDLEQKADTLRKILEEVMDDEDELRELNLSSRPRREERRRQREREKLERELERAREIKEEIEERLEDDVQAPGSSKMEPIDIDQYGDFASSSAGSSEDSMLVAPTAPGLSAPDVQPWDQSPASAPGQLGVEWQERVEVLGSEFGAVQPGWTKPVRLDDQLSTSQQQQQQQQHSAPAALHSSAVLQMPGAAPASAPASAPLPLSFSREQRQARIQELRSKFDRARLSELRSKFVWMDREKDRDKDERRRLGSSDREDAGAEREDWMRRTLEGSEEDIIEAQEALEEMVEQEEEEQEVEEVEDLIEYYLQRASATQDEAERLLAEARDLEESIGISLSARRYEVNRLELTLSIGSFAASIGAMVAGLFGMNMRSMLEHSVLGFWGTCCMIVLGCCSIFATIMLYTRRKRIL